MHKKLKLTLTALLSLAIISAPLLLSPAVHAADCNGQETYFNWNCNKGDGITSIAVAIFYIVSGLVAAGCLGAIVYGAIRYSASAGNASAAKEGLDVIRNAVIALVLYGCFFALLYLFIGKDISGQLTP
jgi:hypothetical protein